MHTYPYLYIPIYFSAGALGARALGGYEKGSREGGQVNGGIRTYI